MKQNRTAKKTGQSNPEKTPLSKTAIDQTVDALQQDTKERIMVLRQKSYKTEKRNLEEFRKKYGIAISEEDLQKEDRELRKKHGLE